MNRERATGLAENLLQNLDAGGNDWPLSLITQVYVFGSYARGAQEPGDLDIDVELARDEKWDMHVVESLPYGRDPMQCFASLSARDVVATSAHSISMTVPTST